MDLARATLIQIKEYLARPHNISEQVILTMEQDHRQSVRMLAVRLRKQLAVAQAEQDRLAGLYQIEKELWTAGYRYIAGADEAGRGPLAGPVVAAAVVFAEPVYLNGLNDSKQIAPEMRVKLARQIKKRALTWAVMAVSPAEIDRVNILNASLQAMNLALNKLRPVPEFVLTDGNRRIPAWVSQRTVVHGDALSASIAAASILAKVYRDRLMNMLDKVYPGYGLAKHKGYPTREHVEALLRLGPTPIYRRSFLKKDWYRQLQFFDHAEKKIDNF